ncbi:hypothetical protein SAMN04487895_115105 [Paenibacillus sophorae]|uniref:Uncharacterized protein n=1 Tax=Paenibacillus sophorae TaxID=1333845 RepID=A0A1H8U038_9BACL|nr:hypothetical protein [Paenibacillus sophorae]SEO96028.1 hypothetical protein SAMN04487895_115105 [Paenibacillus sophorae]
MEREALLSLDKQVNTSTLPAFLWHTVEDASVPVEISMMYAAAFKSTVRMPYLPEGQAQNVDVHYGGRQP